MARKKRGVRTDGKVVRPDKITFEYIKSNSFRVIHADGAWGGTTPNQHILIAFWSERPPIPKRMVFQVTPDGTLGDELKEQREGKEGIVREVEASVIMDLATAKVFSTWLQERINSVEQKKAE